MKILLIPDVHLKPWVFDRASEILKSGSAEKAVCLMDIPDDWGKEYNLGLYEDTFDAAIRFQQAFRDTLWCYGNHDLSYEWLKYESGFSSMAVPVVNAKLSELRRELPAAMQKTYTVKDMAVVGSSTVCLTDEQYDKSIGAWADLARQKDAEGFYLAFGEAVYPEEVFEQSRDALIAAAATVTDDELARFIILAEGLRGYDVTGEIGSIKCPVLAIGSEDDKVLGGTATQQIAELLKDYPDCESYVYEAGYGHVSYDTAPDYKDRIQEFFAK